MRFDSPVPDGAAEVVVEDSGPAQSPLVSITFQRDVNWKKKYLEAEPKALGVGLEIVGLRRCSRTLSCFVCLTEGFISEGSCLLFQLKACLVMEIVASLASFCNIMMSLIENSWEVSVSLFFCHSQRVSTRFFAGSLLIHSALLAISITLVVYCCKVVKCCGPPPKVPMITVQTPPRHHDQETAQRSTHE
uniref:Uncharacterized protein n=1 Tax=Oryzias melastigma TaxID=30732 RepID=A0A3B3D4Q0_ORYME